MKIGPKYKIARRLGAPIFEKTQTAKFAASKEKKKPLMKSKSSFGQQLNEKQKARLTYGITEKQFKNYAKKVLAKASGSQTDNLYGLLEGRLDNVVYRAGFASTRRHARQLVSHGHIKVNNIRVTIPSYATKKGDEITIRKESESKPVFVNLEERLKNRETSTWTSLDLKTKTVKITDNPKYEAVKELFDLQAVFEYYRR
jgi:small subunit ribosomal protein S4